MDPGAFGMQHAMLQQQQQPQMQRPQGPGMSDQQLHQKILEEITKRPGRYNGWQAAVDNRERAALVMQLIGILRTISGDDLVGCCRNAMIFEHSHFGDSMTKDHYVGTVRFKVNQAIQARQHGINGIVFQPGNSRSNQMLMQQVMSLPTMTQQPNMLQPPQPTQNFATLNDLSMTQQHQLQQQQNNPFSQQHIPMQPSVLPPDQTMATQQQQQQDHQHSLNNAPASNSQFTVEEVQTIKAQARQQIKQIPKEQQAAMRHKLFANMTPEQRDICQRQNLDPLERHFQNMAIKRFEMQKAQMQGRLPQGQRPNQPQQQQQQQQHQIMMQNQPQLSQMNPMNQMVAAQAQNMQRQASQATPQQQQAFASGQNIDFSAFLGQQADAVKMQESGQLVVPASNNNNAAGNANANPAQGAQPNLPPGMQIPPGMTPQQFQQRFLQQQQQQQQAAMRWSQMNGQAQPIGQPMMANASQGGNMQMAGQNSIAQPSQLRGQPGGLHANQQSQQQSPAMAMLNRPMAPPNQQVQSPQNEMQAQRSHQTNPQIGAPNMISQPSSGPGMAAPSLQPFSMQIPPNMPPQMRQQMQSQQQNAQIMAMGMNNHQGLPTNLNQSQSAQTMSNGALPEDHQRALQLQFQEFEKTALPPLVRRDFGQTIPPHAHNWAQLKQHYQQIGALDLFEQIKKIQIDFFRAQHNAQKASQAAQQQSQPQPPSQFPAPQANTQPPSSSAPQMTQQSMTAGPGPQGQMMSSSGNQQIPMTLLAKLPILQPTPQEMQVLKAQINNPDMPPAQLFNIALQRKLMQAKSNPTVWRQVQQQMTVLSQQTRNGRVQSATVQIRGQMAPGQTHMFANQQTVASQMSQAIPSSATSQGSGMTNGQATQQQQQQLAGKANVPGNMSRNDQSQAAQQQTPNILAASTAQLLQASPQVKVRISQLVTETEASVKKGSPETINSPQDLAVRTAKLKKLLPLVAQLERMCAFALTMVGEDTLRKMLVSRANIIQQINKDGTINGYISLSEQNIDEHTSMMQRFLSFIGIKFMEKARQQPGQGTNSTTTAPAPTPPQSKLQTPVLTVDDKPAQAAMKAPKAATSGAGKAASTAASRKASATKAQSAQLAEQSALGFGASSPHGVPLYDGKPGGLSADKLHIPARKKQKTAGAAASTTNTAATPAAQVGTPGANSTASPEVRSKAAAGAQQKGQEAGKVEAQREPERRFKCRDDVCEFSIRGFEKETELRAHYESAHAPVADPLQFFVDSIAAYYDVDIQGNSLKRKATTSTADLMSNKMLAATPGAKSKDMSPVKVKRDALTPASLSAMQSPASQRLGTTSAVAEAQDGNKKEQQPTAEAPSKTMREVLAANLGLPSHAASSETVDKPSDTDIAVDLIAEFGASLGETAEFDIFNWPAGVDLTTGMPSPRTLTPVTSENAESADEDPWSALTENERYQRAFGWTPGGPDDLELLAIKRMGMTPDSGDQQSPANDKYTFPPKLTFESVFGETSLSAQDRPAEDWDKDRNGENLFNLDFLDEFIVV